MKIQEFERAIKEGDFAVGDSFWMDDFEFEVIDRRHRGISVHNDKIVFKWELTKEEFIQVIRDNHSEIENPEALFREHEDETIHYFAKGFDALVGECGATYETVINNAIDEVIK